MESFGVASAALGAVKRVGFLTIRSIADFADETKSDDWRDYSQRPAVAFFRSGPITPSEGTWPKLVAPVLGKKLATPIAVRKRLFDRLCVALDVEEFKTLCFLLGVDLAELPGDRKLAQVRELIPLFERRGHLSMLEQALQQNHMMRRLVCQARSPK